MLDYVIFCDKVSELEKQWRFDEAIQELTNYISDLEKSGTKLVERTKKIANLNIKYLVWKFKGGEQDFYHPYSWIGAIYLKIGTQQALDYWLSLTNSPYYEDNSEFKLVVNEGYYTALEKHQKGYVYKPQTKENQQKFLEYAKTKGWR